MAAIPEAWADVWADDVAGYERMLLTTAPVRQGLAGLIEDDVYWQVLALDAAVARSSDASHGNRASFVADDLTRATSVFSDEIDEQPEMCRELLVSVGRAWATLSGLEQKPDPRLAARMREIHAIVESDGVAKPYALIGDAFLREAAGDAGVLDAWRRGMALIEDISSPVAVPVRIEHEARYRLGLALAASGEKTEAIALLRRVAAEAPPHGMDLFARWAREALTRMGSGSTATSGPFDDLTPRELEVLALVAEGLTNRAIGARLCMSPKTASVHVSAILAKFGAKNRAEAAAYYTSRQASDRN